MNNIAKKEQRITPHLLDHLYRGADENLLFSQPAISIDSASIPEKLVTYQHI